MQRRDFITLLGGAAASSASWPPAVRAEQAAKPIIGLLIPGTPASHGYAATLQRLRELGWVEGRTIAVEYRWAEGFGELLSSRPISSGSRFKSLSREAPPL
jgi:putative ABC transport system substrate-binding protein